MGLDALIEIYNETIDYFAGETSVTLGQVLDNTEFQSLIFDTFEDNVIDVMDLGLMDESDGNDSNTTDDSETTEVPDSILNDPYISTEIIQFLVGRL